MSVNDGVNLKLSQAEDGSLKIDKSFQDDFDKKYELAVSGNTINLKKKEQAIT